MSIGNRQLEFHLEDKLANLRMTPSQHAEALSAMRMAEDVVDVLEVLIGLVKRLAEAVSLKPSVRT